MEELIIPRGKQLRYRCRERNCSSTKTFSLVSIMDHLALHYDKYLSFKSGKIFNYYCNLCKVPFYVLGMCSGCKCQHSGSEEQFVLTKSKVTLEDIKREVHFFVYVHKNAVPVLENVANGEPRTTSKSLAEVERLNGESHCQVSQEEPSTQHSERRSRMGRPNPPPLPRRKTGVGNGQTSSREPRERRSRSTVRRPPVKSRQDSLLTENPSPPLMSRRQSRSPAPRSRVTLSHSPASRMPAVLVEREVSNEQQNPGIERATSSDLRIPVDGSHKADAWKTMPSPSQYPDGSSRTPRYDDDEEEIEPAYFRAVRSRSQSRCQLSAMAESDKKSSSSFTNEDSAPKTVSSNGGKGAVWNGTLRKPERFSNVFSERNAAVSSPSDKVSRDFQTQQTAQLQPPPPIPDMADPPLQRTEFPSDDAAEPSSLKQPPLLPSKEAFINTVRDNQNKAIVSDPNVLPPPPPPPPSPSSPGVKPMYPGSSTSNPVLSVHAQKDSDARNHSTSTVRTLKRRSRQDALLEENPPPPRSPRRLSRSPGPRAPLCPSFDRQSGPITPAQLNTSSLNSRQTPGYVSHSISMGFDASCGSSQTATIAPNMPHDSTPSFSASHNQAFRTTPHYTPRTPMYCQGSPDYENDSRTLYGGRTPNGGRTPSPGHSLEPHTLIYTPLSPSFVPSTPAWTQSTTADGSRTPSYEPSSSSSEQINSTVNISSKSHGANTGFVVHTPMRRPESYPNGTPRSPRFEDDEEEVTPAYMRSPRNPHPQNEGHDSHSAIVSDPLSLNNRARTPPPPSRAAFQNDSSPVSSYRPSVNGFPPGRPPPPPFLPSPPNPFMYIPPFGQNHMPLPNQFAPWFTTPSNAQFGSVQRVPDSHPNTSSANTSKSSKENSHSTIGVSKKSVPPQRAGGSVFLDTPPPPKELVASSMCKKEHAKRKRRRSYDRSDSD